MYTNTPLAGFAWSTLTAVVATGGSKAIISGSLVSIDADTSEDQDIKALVVGSNTAFGGGSSVTNRGYINAMNTTFKLNAGGAGTVKRAVNENTDGTGIIEAQYQWPGASTPPNIQSINGADTFVETDCDISGDCSGNGTPPLRSHMMVYDDSCNTNGPWFNMAMNDCRQ